MTMSQPSSAALRSNARRTAWSPRLTVTIVLTTPSALTLRFGTTDMTTGTGGGDPFLFFDSGLEADPITDAADYLGPGPNLCAWQFSIVNRTLSNGWSMDSLLSSYQFRGARVTAHLRDTSLPAAVDALQVFDGVISQVTATPFLATFACSQPVAWDRTVPPTIDAVKYPKALDSSLGLVAPIIGGDHSKKPPILPFGSGNDKDHDQSGGGRLAVPCITVDPGLDAAPVKVLVACHLMKKLIGYTDGHGTFVQGPDAALAAIDGSVAGLLTETLGAGESFITIDDGKLVAFAAVTPQSVATVAATVNNSAGSPRYAMTPLKMDSWAVIDQTAAKNALVLQLPNASSLGKLISVEVCVAFSPAATSTTQKLRIRPCNTASGTYGTTILSAAALGVGTAQILRGTWDAAYYDATWRFADGGAQPNAAIVVDYDSGTVQKANVYWAVLIVKYAPNRTIASQGSMLVSGPWSQRVKVYTKNLIGGGMGWRGGWTDWNHAAQYATTPIYQFDAPVFSNCEGAPDDGGGTITGVAGSLIESPPDLIRWLLSVFGLLDPTTAFETAAGEHGSFVDARLTVRGGSPDPFKMAPYVGEQQKLSAIIKTLCAEALCALWLDRFTGQWRFVSWQLGGVPNYDLTFTWQNIELKSAVTLTNADSVHEIRVQYGYDPRSGRTLWETFISPTGSGSGYGVPAYRDQQPVVVSAANKWIDYKVDAATYGQAVALATYTNMIDLAQAVRDAMTTPGGLTNSIAVGWGYDVKAGYNDTLQWTFFAVGYVTTLNPGHYLTGYDYAAEVQRALNLTLRTAGLPLESFTCVYNPVTSGYMLTCTNNFSVDDTAGFLSPGWAQMGYNARSFGALSRGSDFPRFQERFWFQILDTAAGGGHSTITLLWGTGSHVGTSLGHEMGFQYADGSALWNRSADYTRSTRETSAASALAMYGPCDPDMVQATYINDESTAVRVRNRRFDLRVLDRVIVVFTTTMAPDLQRHRLIQFDASIDAYVAFPRYGSDGSWAGKVFRVVGVTQYLDAQFHQEVTAIEL